MAPLETSYNGFWGKPTTTIDWCEANYEVTHYIAEFWNTLSNFIMIVPPLFAAILSKLDGFEDRFFYCHLSLMIVGIGSWCFHGTLLYGMQLMDELPMIWGSAILVYSFYEVDKPKRRKNYLLMAGLIAYCSIVTVVYLTIKKPIFHECAYALMVFALVALSIQTMRKYESSLLLLILSAIFYGTGFAIWNIDNVFCSHISRIRQEVGYPLKPLLQGHAWWHFFTGTGAYLSILFCVDARSRYINDEIYIQNVLGLWPVARRSNPLAKKD